MSIICPIVGIKCENHVQFYIISMIIVTVLNDNIVDVWKLYKIENFSSMIEIQRKHSNISIYTFTLSLISKFV